MTTDFADFVRLRYAELLRSAYLLSGSSHAAEDLLQTALLKAMGRWSTVEDPLPYIRRSMVNLHVSVWRRYGVQDLPRVGFGTVRTRSSSATRSSTLCARCRRAPGPSWCCATGTTCPRPTPRPR